MTTTANKYYQEILGAILIEEGMLEFNEATACCWGGPYPGNKAAYLLMDCRKQRTTFDDYTLATESYQNYRDNIIETQSRHKAALRAAYAPQEPPASVRPHWWDREEATQRPEQVTPDKPFSLYLTGNDDTSYTKFFATQEEAVEALELLKACQPLDFEEDFMDETWIFTN